MTSRIVSDAPDSQATRPLGLSVVIIAKNESARIRRCLESVRWATEIVVVDQCSTDGTADVCREYGARVVVRDMRAGFGEQKNFALAQASQPWILSLDADEEVTPALRAEIARAVADPGPYVAYRAPRLTSYLGRFIRHCGWYPRPVLRLVRRDHGRFTDALVHEELVADGPVGELGADLLHWSYDSLADHLRKLDLYTGLDAEMLVRRGVRVTWWRVAAKPALVFLRKYVVQRGFLEGREGLILSAMAAFAVFVTHVRAWERAAGPIERAMPETRDAR
jgi:glycosyltransferase involved in cell wall biosynthesis